MNSILCRQLSEDLCCTVEEVSDKNNHFTVYEKRDGRRVYREKDDVFLKIAVVNSKLLFSGKRDIIDWCRETFAETGGEWFFEARYMRMIDDKLREYGRCIGSAHPFYISETPSYVDTSGYEIRRYEQDDIKQFRGDDRYKEAYGFCETAPDMLGIAAVRDGEILGMAGASRDSRIMWQIGIDVAKDNRSSGIGTMLVTLLKNEIISRGILPFYGTAASHLASQRVALGAGFLPTWLELYDSDIQQ